MFLTSIALQYFRAGRSCEVHLKEHLTLLVGENDGGKSAVIDAIRLSTSNALARPGLYFDIDRDLTWGHDERTIRIRRRFTGLTPIEEGIFSAVLLDAHKDLIYTTHYRTGAQLARRDRFQATVAEGDHADPEPENRDRIAHVYLQPLRDAVRDLDSPDGNRVAEIISVLCSKDDQDAFVTLASDTMSALLAHSVATNVQASVQRHLSAVTDPVRPRTVALRQAEPTIRRLARSLRLHMAAEGLEPSGLLGSGLGYANLLYIASVVLELEKAKEHDLTLLLVEEPEAHLHPQLQAVLLAYLFEEAKQSASKVPDNASGYAGRIQIIATTHSPHLASVVPIEHVVVMRGVASQRASKGILKSGELEGNGALPAAPVEELAIGELSVEGYVESTAIAIQRIGLDPTMLRKINRYLHATRAALLFARQVILVEGIAETLLLRAFVDLCLYPDFGPEEVREQNRRRREQFQAVSLVAIDGVDFEPYVRLLVTSEPTLVDRLVVLTDGDNDAGRRRQERYLLLGAKAAEKGLFHVEVGNTTLEADLYGPLENEPLLRTAFARQHPQSLEKWDVISQEVEGVAKRSQAFSAALKSGGFDLGKGDFAQDLCLLLEESQGQATFVIPDYITRAIDHVLITKGS